MKTTELFAYLNKLGLADQVHFRNNNQIVFYHWNKVMSELLPSLTLQDNQIEKIYYPRSMIPKVYTMVEETFEVDFTDKDGYTRNYRD